MHKCQLTHCAKSTRTRTHTHIHTWLCEACATMFVCTYVCMCVQKAQQIVHKKRLNFEIQVQGQMTTVF